MKKIHLLTLCLMFTPLTAQTMHNNKGFLFSIEGTEGCGKTTLIQKLSSKLFDAKCKVVTTREPGATELGKEIRSMLMNKSTPTCTLAELFLFAADRAQHFQEFIIPHLNKNYIVISDRMADSSLVYQGYVKGLNQNIIKTINQWAMQYDKPDLVIYLKIDIETAMKRIEQRNKNNNEESVPFEQEILQKKQQLIDGFDAILLNRNDVITIDATSDAEDVADQAFKAIMNFIHNNKS